MKIIHSPLICRILRANALVPCAEVILVRDDVQQYRVGYYGIVNDYGMWQKIRWQVAQILRHELVHIKQLRKLCMRYGAFIGHLIYYFTWFKGLFVKGYKDDPIEKEAYELQGKLYTLKPYEVNEWLNDLSI